jgi:hypothetical protein
MIKIRQALTEAAVKRYNQDMTATPANVISDLESPIFGGHCGVWK